MNIYDDIYLFFYRNHSLAERRYCQNRKQFRRRVEKNCFRNHFWVNARSEDQVRTGGIAYRLIYLGVYSSGRDYIRSF